MESWFKSRKWLQIFASSVPILLLGAILIPVFRGMSLDKRTLTNRYGQLASTEVAKIEQSEGTEDASAESRTRTGMPLLEIAYRRLLTIEPFNQKARFYVARVMEKRGQNSQALALITDLAPSNSTGLVEAHEWLVRKMIERAQRGKVGVPERELSHHLRVVGSSSKPAPDLLVLQSSILERQGNIEQAMTVLEKASSVSPKYALNLASFSQKYNKVEAKKVAAKRAQTYLEGELKKVDATTSEEMRELIVSQLALCMSLQDNLDEAMKTLREGLRPDKPCLQIRNSISTLLVVKFQKQLESVKKLENVSLADLEAAMSWDPANPMVAAVISQLLVLQSAQSPSLKSMLERNVTEGGGSSLLHLLLANEAILGQRLDESIPHLEIALSHHPNSTSILNNFALVLATKSQPDSERAMSLIDKAITIGGENAELMDTKGQILASVNRDIEAIRCYEKAIGQQPGRVRSRERLVELYERQNMKELASAQRDAIVDLKARLAAQAAAQIKPSTPSVATLPSFCEMPDLSGRPPTP